MRRTTAVSLVGLAIMAATGSVEAQNRQDRRGFWIGFGVGGGSFGCEDCSREGGFSGHFKLGGTPSRKLLVGGETNGWVKEEEGATLSMSNVSAVVYFYPSATGGFHLKGGLGLSVLSLDIDLGGGTTLSTDDTGGGLLLGLGYDARLGRNVSLVPFFNFLGGSFDGDTANFWQLGVGLTWH